MGDISLNFSRSEFACECGCGFDCVDTELLKALEGVRINFGKSIKVTSGNRCSARNELIGGADGSKHKLGIAADIKVHNVEPERVANYLNAEYPDKYGIGIYSSWIHVDVRKTKARWEK